MMHFVGRCVAHCIQIAFMLMGALLFMQLPALTHGYTVALLQVAQDARHYYHLAPDAGDQAVIGALRPVEPFNAETLDRSPSRAAMFDTTHSLIARAPSLRQPLVAGWDAMTQPQADKIAVLRTSISTYVPQVALDLASLVCGLAGLLLGGLLGHALCEAPATAVRQIRWQNTVGR